MAGTNPLVPQGVLNKLRASVSLISLPDLNIIQSFLTDDGISLAFEGEASGYIPTMTGAVPSPNPYQIATATVHILKTQGLAQAWKQQQETNTNLGDIAIKGDAATLSDYYLSNCALMGVGELDFSGKTPAYVLSIRGIYYLNAGLFSAA
jgi:hypothetical protein